MELINIIIGLANALGIIILIFNIGRLTGRIDSYMTSLSCRIKRVEDRCEEICLRE